MVQTPAASRLGASEAVELFRLAPLAELQERAQERRRAILPASEATYCIMRIVSVTNICVADCPYCAFYRRPGRPEGYVLSHEAILEKIDTLLEKGGALVAMEGGFNPALKLDHYEKLFRVLRRRYQDHIEIYGPTIVEVLFIARNSKVGVSEALTRLRESGLRWIPGGGAEILTEAWRRKLSPKKYSVSQYLETMELAQRLGFGTTATMVIGFGEPYEARVEHLQRIRDLQDKTGGFTSFLLWTYQNQNTALGGSVTSNEDYLRTVALSRLFLDNIPHVRASLLTQGASGALSLKGGADDFDIALEDQVTEQAGVTIEKNIETVLGWVRQAGLIPVPRKPWAVSCARAPARVEGRHIMVLPSETQIIEKLKGVLDPELHIDVVNLGLIYGIERKEEEGKVRVQLGLTSPACPYAPELQRQAQETVSQMEGVQCAEVELTLSPPWDPRTMASDEAKDMLGIF